MLMKYIPNEPSNTTINSHASFIKTYPVSRVADTSCYGFFIVRYKLETSM